MGSSPTGPESAAISSLCAEIKRLNLTIERLSAECKTARKEAYDQGYHEGKHMGKYEAAATCADIIKTEFGLY